MAKRVWVADYGASNLRSVVKALEILGYEVIVATGPAELTDARALVLPGVGAAGQIMRSLRSGGLDEAIVSYIGSGRPFLGVCMGMQVLMDRSEEDGGQACLGVFHGEVRRLPPGTKIPHMGWNTVEQRQPHWAWRGISDSSYFYFVHSYAVVPEDPSLVAGVTDYAGPFVSAIGWETGFGTQFHPEKSGRFGLEVYRSFLQWALK